MLMRWLNGRGIFTKQGEAMSKSDPAPSNPSQIIRPASIASSWAVGTPTIWLNYSFAPEWFNDALTEARTGKDHHARRREILFAVCCAESPKGPNVECIELVLVLWFVRSDAV